MSAKVDGTRITLFLPVNSFVEVSAANAVISAVLHVFNGVTYSELQRPVFTGYWTNGATKEVYRDRISFTIIDVPQDLASEELSGRLDDLRGLVFNAYRDAGASQLDVWVIASSIVMIME